jgi:hypothetical protein
MEAVIGQLQHTGIVKADLPNQINGESWRVAVGDYQGSDAGLLGNNPHRLRVQVIFRFPPLRKGALAYQ